MVYLSVDSSIPGAVQCWDHHVTGELLNMDSLPERNVPASIAALRAFAKEPSRLIKPNLTADEKSKPQWTPALRVLAATGEGEWPPRGDNGRDALLRRLFAASVDEARELSRRLSSLATRIAPWSGAPAWLMQGFALAQREHWVPVAAAMAVTLARSRAAPLAELELERRVDGKP